MLHRTWSARDSYRHRTRLGGGSAGRRSPHPYRYAPMAEHPESDPSIEQLVSVLTKSVMTDGPARRYGLLCVDYMEHN